MHNIIFDPNAKAATTSLAFAKIPASERLVTKFDCSGLSEYNYTSNKVAVDGLTYSGTALTPTSETALKHYFRNWHPDKKLKITPLLLPERRLVQMVIITYSCQQHQCKKSGIQKYKVTATTKEPKPMS